jgi:hypothetical protein
MELKDFLNNTGSYTAIYNMLSIDSAGNVEHQLSVADVRGKLYKLTSRCDNRGIEVSACNCSEDPESDCRMKYAISNFNEGRKGNVMWYYFKPVPLIVSGV